MLNLKSSTQLFFAAICLSAVLAPATVKAQATAEFRHIHEQTNIRQDLDSEGFKTIYPNGKITDEQRTRALTDLNSQKEERVFGASGQEAYSSEDGARGYSDDLGPAAREREFGEQYSPNGYDEPPYELRNGNHNQRGLGGYKPF